MIFKLVTRLTDAYRPLVCNAWLKESTQNKPNRFEAFWRSLNEQDKKVRAISHHIVISNFTRFCLQVRIDAIVCH